MKVLVLGSGAREHAIASKFSQSEKVSEIIVAPGNAGIAKEFSCITLPSFEMISDFVESENIDLVFVGPEQPLSEGVVDYLESKGIKAIGPSKLASQIESSKAFAKDLMQKMSVPTADYAVFQDYAAAKEYLSEVKYPVVFKADGLAAGKGVVIVTDREMAERELKEFMLDEKFGKAGDTLVIEEFLVGWETSIFAFTDGTSFQTTLFSMDHKQLLAGDKGPNTGGMGAVAPIKMAEPYRKEIEDKVFTPILQGMQNLGCPFKGVLYCGLMITAEGPKVVEFNCRFGDPETQVVLPLLKSDFVDVCEAIVAGNMNEIQLEWEDKYAVNVVCASAGYPGSYPKGKEITISELGSASKIYFAGVKEKSGKLLTNGGRVLGVTSLATSRDEAITTAYNEINSITFAGKTIRSDIGGREAK